jgi:coenzyme F420-0:L-glutamate ligase/coenzyme F420-1:gamma-L-glutamate ligase
VRPGDDLPALLLEAVNRLDGAAGEPEGLRDGDVLVLAQKIVSKAEGRLVDLATVAPSPRALELAAQVGKDPRLCELVLRESREVVRAKPGVLIVEHRIGVILANAGIDHSNVEQPPGTPEGADERVLLLPEDPDRSAAELRRRLEAATRARLAVVIADSVGRPWRLGAVGIAIGCAGLPALLDLRGAPDLHGRPLRVTDVGHADQLAAAASLLLGQAAEGLPAVLVRGLPPAESDLPARAVLRPRAQDLFR